jgi:hypothetical protein
MQKITLSVELVNQILAYLGTRPYQEVFQIVETVQKEAKESLLNGNQEANDTAS